MSKFALVLEDEECIRDMVGQVLADNGYHIRTFASPVETTRNLEESHVRDRACVNDPDVIVSDNRMPHVTGLEYVRGLRLAGRSTRHIALMSGDWHPDEVREAESMGCKIFSKPFPLSDLHDWIQSLPPQ